MAGDTQTNTSSNGGENTLKPSVVELLLPPLACLFFFSTGLIIWTLANRRQAQKQAFQIDDIDLDDDDRNYSRTPRHNKTVLHDHLSNKVSPSEDLSNESVDPIFFTLEPRHLHHNLKGSSREDSPDSSLSFPSLFQRRDLPVVDHLRGRGTSDAKEVFFILLPMIFSLGFCPLTLLLRDPIIRCIWPPDMFPEPPNINDAIGCFLVPAGMVYAICFGFAFQQVTESFKETGAGVCKQVQELIKVLTLLKSLTVISKLTRLAMIRVIKDMTLDSLACLLDLKDDLRSDAFEGLEKLLRLLYIDRRSSTTSLKDMDPWQLSVYERLEKLLTQEGMLSTRFLQTRLHPLEWAFLECLGYFTFFGMLLVQCFSYRADLIMCLLTVLSISLLCFIVADLDSPFHGFFRVPLGGFALVIQQLDHEFAQITADILLDRSFADF